MTQTFRLLHIYDLQSVLNTFENYTEKWSITVNVNKTNKMVFRNGGILLTED